MLNGSVSGCPTKCYGCTAKCNRCVTRRDGCATMCNGWIIQCNGRVTKSDRSATKCNRSATKCNRCRTKCERSTTKCNRSVTTCIVPEVQKSIRLGARGLSRCAAGAHHARTAHSLSIDVLCIFWQFFKVAGTLWPKGLVYNTDTSTVPLLQCHGGCDHLHPLPGESR